MIQDVSCKTIFCCPLPSRINQTPHSSPKGLVRTGYQAQKLQGTRWSNKAALTWAFFCSCLVRELHVMTCWETPGKGRLCTRHCWNTAPQPIYPCQPLLHGSAVAFCSCWWPLRIFFSGILPNNHPPNLCPSRHHEPWDSFHKAPGTSFHILPCRFTWKQWHSTVSTSGGDPGKQSSSPWDAGMEAGWGAWVIAFLTEGFLSQATSFPQAAWLWQSTIFNITLHSIPNIGKFFYSTFYSLGDFKELYY